MDGSELRLRGLKRCLALLRVLADGQVHERRRLARRLKVSQRTVRRDVYALIEAGVPVEHDICGSSDAPTVAAYRMAPEQLTSWFRGGLAS